MRKRAPDSASMMLPSTGASSRPTALGRTDASRRTAAGPTVDISIIVADPRVPAAMPVGPSVTVWSAGGFDTIVMTTSAWLAASAGVAADVAPRPTS